MTPARWLVVVSIYDVNPRLERQRSEGEMTHQFQPGQTVRLCRSLSHRSAAEGDYKIIRWLPDTGGELQYRIKSVREPHERVVKESDLETA